MMNNIRILDYNLQLSRIFGIWLGNYWEGNYETKEVASGKYDIVVSHREGFQDEFEELLTYTTSETKIVVDVTTESGNLQMFLNDFVNKTNSIKNKFYLIVDSDLTNFLGNVKIGDNVKILYGFDLVFYSFLNEFSDDFILNTDDIFGNKNSFMSLNNSCRLHRIFLLFELLKRDISLENCSFLFTTGGPNGYRYNEKVLHDGINQLLNESILTNQDVNLLKIINLPKHLDCNLENNQFIQNKINYLYDSILNLVSENVVGMTTGDISEYGLITFTEKIIKPFLAKQIPLFIALPGLQNELRKLGFDLFDDLIDTSYELEKSPTRRIEMIVDELERLLDIDLVEYKNKHQNRFDHNYELLKILTKKGEDKVKSFLYDEILK